MSVGLLVIWISPAGRFLEEAAGVNAELLPRLEALQLHEDAVLAWDQPIQSPKPSLF